MSEPHLAAAIVSLDLGARPRYEPVNGAPFQPGERVRVVDAIDLAALDLSSLVGSSGVVSYLEYDCGSGQTFPRDPMIGVRLDSGIAQEFWPEELEAYPGTCLVRHRAVTFAEPETDEEREEREQEEAEASDHE